MKSNNIRKNVVWNTVGTMYYFACQWVITILVVRLGDYSLAGYLSLAMTITNTFYAIAQFGMRQFQVSDLEEKYSDRIYIGSRYISMLMGLLMCNAYVFFRGYNKMQIACTISYMLLKSVEAFVDVYQGIDQKNWRFDIIGKSLIIRGTIIVVGFAIGLVIIGNLPIVLLLVALLSLFIVFIYDIKVTKTFADVRGEIRNSKVKQLLLECLPIVIFNFLLSSITLIARNTLQNIEGIESLGIYSSVASPVVIIQLFASVIFNPFVPLFTSYYLEKENYKFFKLLGKFLFFLVLLLFTTILGAVLLGEQLLVWVIGPSIKPYSYLLIPVIVCTIVTATIWLLSATMIAIRKMKSLVFCTAIGGLVCLAISRICVEQYSMNGVSFAIIVSGVVQVLLMLSVCMLAVRGNLHEE